MSTQGSDSRGRVRMNCCMSVSMIPGRTAMARKPGAVRSTASARVSISSPALATQYRLSPAKAVCAAPEDTLMMRRACAASAKMRQKRLVRATTAARLTANDATTSGAASVPSVPTGPAVAALLSRQTDAGLIAASARRSGASVSSRRAASARSKRAKRKRSPASVGLGARPMPRTVNPRSSSAAASEAPRPRETPVTIAACTASPPPSPTVTSAVRPKRQTDQDDDDDRNHEQRQLDPALGILTLDRAGEAVHDRLEALGTVTVGEQPYRGEQMLERLPGVGRLHVEVAIGVARDLRGTHLAKLRIHRLACGPGRGDEINLITLDDPAGDVAGIVGFELLGGKRFDSAHQRLVYADRGADEIVIEEVRQLARGRLPAHVLDLARLGTAAAVGVSLGRVVVMTGFGGPRG